MKNSNSKKMSANELALMILSSIFGFANVTVAYNQMGYASIIWYVFAAFVFFLPSGLMFAEYGSAFSTERGGIYSWLKNSIGDRLAFIGTFIWLSGWIIWMISVASKVWIPLSNIFFGTDKTSTWHLFNFFNSMQTIGILAIIWVIVVTLSASQGFNQIAKVAGIGGFFSMILPIVFVFISIIVLIENHGHLAQPISGISAFIKSPNVQFANPIALMSFIVYAIFAYGGMETTGGVVNQVNNPKKNYPRGIIIAAVIMTLTYALSIFFVGVTANWNKVLGNGNVNLGNITYVLVNNLGFVTAKTFGASHEMAILCGDCFARFAGLSMFISYIGAFFVLIYSPLESFLEGTDKRIWPKKVVRMNKHGMPAFAMWVQALIIALVIFAISFGGSGTQKFYLILTDMGNISSAFPYLFLIGAFPFFKKLSNIERPFVFFKSGWETNLTVFVMMVVITLGICFTAIQPILTKDYETAFWTVIGPLAFGLVGWLLYENGIRNIKLLEK